MQKGSVETAGQTNDLHVVTDERKIIIYVDLVVSELGRCKIEVAALQETKWFAADVYRMGERVCWLLVELCRSRVGATGEFGDLGWLQLVTVTLI